MVDYDGTRVKCGNTLLAKDNQLPVPPHCSSTLVMFGFTSCAKPKVMDHGQPEWVQVEVRPTTVTLSWGRLYWQLGRMWQHSTGQGQHTPPAIPPMQHLCPDSLCSRQQTLRDGPWPAWVGGGGSMDKHCDPQLL